MAKKHHKKPKIKKKNALTQNALQLPGVKSSSSANLYSSVKANVYNIIRMRPIPPGKIASYTMLGTGFLVGDNRLATCCHVVNGDESPHQDGDNYIFIQKDEFGNWHRAILKPKLSETLFCYEDKDFAVFYLAEDFYSPLSQPMRDAKKGLTLSRKIFPIGSEVGVLGYPLPEMRIVDDEIDMTGIVIRGDRGIVNTAYAQGDIGMYEFTIAFNPGNSGGPIFSIKTGEVIAMVHAYNSIPLKFVKEDVPENQQQDIGSKIVRSSIRALYSLGIATASFVFSENEHGLKFN